MKTVKEISELTGISIRALRYYDEIGLLVPTDRTDAGYRLYDDEALEKLRAILFLKELDIPLDTIKEMVNAKNCDYGAVLKNYRKNIVQKINRLQGLLGVVDGMELEGAPISFKAFKVEDAEKVTETIVRSQDMDDSVISEISELVKANMVDGKVGIELLQIYGSREKYLCAVDESQQHPEVTEKLQEELKNIYFSFREKEEVSLTEKTDIRDLDEKVVEIEMERLRNFTNHPFKVIGDSQMIELQDSIKKYGVLNPLIVRPRKEGYYEIISGHRRKYAAERLGYKKIPVIIRMMQDDEAVVTMVDSNLQREQITPSEKAYAYKRKYDAIKKKAVRKNCGQVDHNTGKRSIDVIGELCGDSAKQVQRYIKMTELIPALLDKVDDGSMGFTPAVQLSYLKKKEQQEIIDAMEATQCTPSLLQVIKIKKLSEAGKLTESEAEGILGEIKQKEADRVVFKNEQLYRFFPSTYTSEQMRREILEILKSWRNSNWI